MKCYFCDKKLVATTPYYFKGIKITSCFKCANEKDLRTFGNEDGFQKERWALR